MGIVIPLLIWAVVFEVVLPSTQGWSELTFADPNDVLAYTLGAALATGFWAWWYGTADREGRSTGPRHLGA